MTDVKLQILRGDLDKLAKHEAAHLIIARALGFETGHVSVVADENGYGRGEAHIDLAPDLREPGTVVEYLRRRLCVLYAGVTSETVLMNETDRDEADKNLETLSSDDYSKIRELQRVLAGIERKEGEDFAAAYKRIENEVRMKTDELVLRFDIVIERLADALRGKIRNRGERAVVEKWDEPILGSGCGVEEP